MGNSAAWQATDQIGPVLGSDFVASFDHLAGTRVRTRMFESAKEAAPASSFWEKHIRTGVPDKSQKKVSPKSRTKSRATGATPSQTIPSQGIPEDWTLEFSRGLGETGVPAMFGYIPLWLRMYLGRRGGVGTDPAAIGGPGTVSDQST